MESCTRPRSWESSASRRSSSADILLNSSPSAANSSRPTVGTCAEKSPAASLRAAVRKPAISRCSVRETRIAQAIASSRKPSRITPANVLLLESDDVSPLSAASREPSVRTRIFWPANERDAGNCWTRYSVPSIVAVAPSAVGSLRSFAAGSVLASTRLPLRTIVCRPVISCARLTYVRASVTETSTRPSTPSRADLRSRMAGAMA